MGGGQLAQEAAAASAFEDKRKKEESLRLKHIHPEVMEKLKSAQRNFVKDLHKAAKSERKARKIAEEIKDAVKKAVAEAPFQNLMESGGALDEAQAAGKHQRCSMTHAHIPMHTFRALL